MRTRTRIAAIVALTVVPAAVSLPPVEAATVQAPTISIAPSGGGVLETGSALDLDVAITNHGSGTLAGGTLRISLGQAPVVGVSTLIDQVDHPGTVLQGYLVATKRSPSIRAGATAQMHVHLARDAVDSVVDARAGARLVGASLDAGTPGVIAYSAVTRIPNGFTGRVGFGSVVPITAPAGTTGIVPAGELAVLTESDGAWRTALDAAAADPQATVLLDPEVQASIRLAGSTAPASATEFLGRLANLPNEVVRLPYADGDVTLQHAAGATRVLAPTSFAGGAVSAPTPGATPATTPSPTPTPTATPKPTGRTSDADLLRWDYAGPDVAWPVPGTVSTSDLRFFADSGYPIALLSSADVADTASRVAAGPHARIGAASVLLADATASRLLATASSGSGVQQDAALADLVALLGTDALTQEASAVLAVPPRSGTSPALARVLGLLTGQPWIRGGTLATFARSTAATSVRLKPRSIPTDRLAPAEAAVQAEAKVRELGAAIRTNAARLTGPQRLALLGVLSTAWRSPQTGYAIAAAGVTKGFRDFVNNVRIDRASAINYVGGSGSLPVNLTNQLDEPVEIVLTGVASNNRLHIEGSEVVDIPAQGGARAKLPVKSISNGDVQVTLTLKTKDGHVIGPPSVVDITVNAGWEAVGAVIFIAALLALFGTGVYRNVRRARRRLKGVS